ncbi:MAG: histidinol-phosphate transaminase [Desulfopila sp.]|nr:histidinol-phosphate transaminase [Desulfopila sp.]
MTKYWTTLVKQLEPYVPGEQPKIDNLIKLNTNENPYGPSPLAVKAMMAQAADTLRLYPDPSAEHLREAIARYYRIDTARVFVGNGSDEVLAHTFQALLCHEKPLLCPDISYSFYPVYCNLYGVTCRVIPLNENFEIVVEDYMQDNGGILFANPNAPTGCFLGLDRIETLLRANRESVVVIDEAYVDFGGHSAVELVGQYDNLLVIQTFSKSRSLAGLRVGFAVGQEGLVEALERVKNSFNSYPLDRFAIYGAAAAMDDTAYFEETRKKIIDSRQWLTSELQNRGFEVLPSRANFVFARNDRFKAEYLSQALRRKNILVRYFNLPRIDNFLRITVGSSSHCEQLVKALDQICVF